MKYPSPRAPKRHRRREIIRNVRLLTPEWSSWVGSYEFFDVGFYRPRWCKQIVQSGAFCRVYG